MTNPIYVQALAGIQTTLHASLFKAQAFFETQLSAQAAMLGLNDVFWLSAVIFVVIIPLVWLTKPSKDVVASAADAGGNWAQARGEPVDRDGIAKNPFAKLNLTRSYC